MDIPIDINPIRLQETGLLETYLPEAERYLEEKALKQDRDIMKRFNDIAGVYGNPIIIGNKTVSFPEEYSAEFTNEEILRLKEMILKNREVFKNGSVHTNKFVTVRNRKQNPVDKEETVDIEETVETEDNENSTDIVKTGDDNQIGMLFAAVILSLLVMIGSITIIKKRGATR